MTDKVAKIQAQLEEHFQYVDAIAQVVLKGHLLIEEALERIIGKFVFHPEHLENANLRFAQKLDVARSMSLDEQDNEMWDLAKAINSLRNELAHSLNSKKRQQKTQRVRGLYLKLLDDEEISAQHKQESDEVVLMWAASFFLGFLTSFESEVDRFKAFVSAIDRSLNSQRHDHVDESNG